jgi:Protein kinase domain
LVLPSNAGKIQTRKYFPCGAVAQLGERVVRNDEATGSIPVSSTKRSEQFCTPERFSRNTISFRRHPTIPTGAKKMNDNWKQFEGKVVDGKFRLQKYVGHSDHSMVFLTEREGQAPQKAAIKLIVSDGADAELAQWKLASTLSHPHLLQIFETGRCQMGNSNLLYAVMEFAEESLADIPADRRLSSSEAEAFLPPVLSALSYLHGQKLVHGHIKPSNIMAAADQVKLSTDSVRAQNPIKREPDQSRVTSTYDPPEAANGMIIPASDVWSLGMTLSEVSVLPDDASDPYVEMIGHLLNPNPQRRWTVGTVSSWLTRTPGETRAQEQKPEESDGRSRKWLLVAAVVLVAVVLGYFGLRGQHPRTSGAPPEPAQAQVASPVAVEPPRAEPAPAPTTTAAKPAPPAPVKATKVQLTGLVPGAVQKKVLPNVPRSARRTIQGHIRVAARVTVDPTGDVSAVNLDDPGPSQYFARLSRESAQGWKFSPSQSSAPRAWVLRFVFSRQGTDAKPEQVNP